MRRLHLSWPSLIAGLCCLLAAQAVAWWAASLRQAGVDDQDLGQVLVELEPGEFAGTLMLGGLRGLVIDLLWLRAINAKDDGRYYESLALTQLITRVQPRFEQVWEFIGHDLSYNIAAEHEDRADKWSWYLVGMEAMARGCQRNPRSHRLLRNFAWMVFHKGADFAAEHERQDWSAILGPLLGPDWPDPSLGIGSGGVADGTVTVAWSQGAARPGVAYLLHREGALVGRARGRADGTLVVVEGLVDDGPVAVVESVGNFALAGRLYARCWELADPDLRQRIHYVIRMRAVATERAAARSRNLGRHREALQGYLLALERWREAIRWAIDPRTALDEMTLGLFVDSYQRNEGRLRERAAWLAQALAVEPAVGERIAAAIRDRDAEAARELLATAEFRDAVAGAAGVRWYDE